MSEPLKVLIVDDSIVFRKAVESALDGEHYALVAGSVRNGEKALEFIRATPPDIVTLDLEMPGMNGIETLKQIQLFNDSRPEATPVKALMLSSHTRRGAEVTVEALAAGAFDFIEKPEGRNPGESIETLRIALREKLSGIPPRSGSYARPALRSAKAHAGASAIRRSPGGVSLVAIGISTGGPKALNEMLPRLCMLVKLPILIVQHMPPGFTKSLAKQLDVKCQASVVEAQDGDSVQEGHVYIAPGGCHMCVRRLGSQLRLELNDAPPENGCRPSVDVLFRSVAAACGSSAVAAILTGMGNDGAKACSNLRSAGARIIAQDESSSVVWGMPGSAVATGLVERVEPLMEIPEAIKAMCGL